MFSPTITVLIYVLTFIYHSFHFVTLTFHYSPQNVSTLEIISNNVATFRIIAKPFLIVTTAISMQPLSSFLTLTENNKPNNRYTIQYHQHITRYGLLAFIQYRVFWYCQYLISDKLYYTRNTFMIRHEGAQIYTINFIVLNVSKSKNDAFLYNGFLCLK